MKAHTSSGHNNRKPASNFSVAAISVVARATNKPHKRWQTRATSSAVANATHKLDSLGLSQLDRQTLMRKQALSAAQQSQHAEAIALFTEVIKLDPKSARDYNNRGLVYFQNGQWDKAILDYNRALELNPNLDSAYNNRANYYAAAGMFLEAILDYDLALDLNPTNTRAWINQGITFREIQMYERAIESFDCALGLGSLTGHVYVERGRTYHLWGDWNCAIADYQKAQVALAIPGTSSPNTTARLQRQIATWTDELLSPLNI